MRKLRLCAAQLILGSVLGGCGWMNDDEGVFVDSRDNYLDAKPSRRLIVPEDLDDSAVRDAWPIPEIEELPLAKVYPKRAPMPSAIWGSDELDAVKIQALGDRRWMVVGDKPDEVWPVVKQFLADNGVAVSLERPESGLVVSEWLVLGDVPYRDIVRSTLNDAKKEALTTGTLGRDQIRLRIEHGIRRGSAEVHVRYLNDVVSVPSDDWPEFSSIAEVEKQVLKVLAEYYAAGVVAQAVSIVGRRIAAEEKALLGKDAAGYPLLRLRVDFERAWATIGQALENAEIRIDAQNRDDGVFEVTIDKEALTGESGSFIARILPGGSDGRDVEALVLRIRPDGAGFAVNVAYPGGRPVPVELGEQILVKLREFAS